MRFKRQFLFLFSFPFKLSARLSQQAMSNTNVSLNCLFFFLLFFFLFFFSFFYLRKYLSPLTYLRLTKPSPFNFSLSFSEYIIPIFKKGRRKNSLSCSYLWQGLLLGFLSLTDEWHPHRIGCIGPSADFCSKILFYAFYGDLPEL